MPERKLLGLEVMRFMAALSVLIWHFQHFAYVGTERPANFVRHAQPLYGVLRPMYDYGHYGVQVFWCVSGFIFFWKYRSLIADRVVGGGTFLALRFSRLYPLHLATLLLVVALQAAHHARQGTFFVYGENDVKHFVLQLFLANGWGLQDGYSFNGPTWSISIEVLVYLSFFLLLRFVSASPMVNVAVVIGWAVSRLAGIDSLISEAFVLFYLGGLAAVAMQRLERTRWSRPAALAATAAALLGAIVILGSGLQATPVFPVLFVLYIPVLLYATARDFRPKRPAVTRGIERAGTLTYASYLIHFPLQLAVAVGYAHAGAKIPSDSMWLLLGFIGTSLLAAFFVYRMFEMPAQAALRAALGPAGPADAPRTAARQRR